jgi:hypothetical protein
MARNEKLPFFRLAADFFKELKMPNTAAWREANPEQDQVRKQKASEDRRLRNKAQREEKAAEAARSFATAGRVTAENPFLSTAWKKLLTTWGTYWPMYTGASSEQSVMLLAMQSPVNPRLLLGCRSRPPRLLLGRRNRHRGSVHAGVPRDRTVEVRPKHNCVQWRTSVVLSSWEPLDTVVFIVCSPGRELSDFCKT